MARLLSTYLLVSALAAGLTGCGGVESTASMDGANGSAPDEMANPGDSSALSDGDGVAVEIALGETLQDEYKARAVYEHVLSDFGNVRPFSNIVEAEARHAQAIEALYESRGLKVPPNVWKNSNEVPRFDSLLEACESAIQGEIDNAAIYDKYLATDLPGDVRETFVQLRGASVDNHLEAFKRCVAREQ